MSEQRFHELLERAQRGDEAAKREVFRLLGEEGAERDAFLAVVRRLLPARAGARRRGALDSQDLAQSTLRAAWSAWTAFRGSSRAHLLAYLRSIAQHKISHAVRRPRPPADQAAVELATQALADSTADGPLQQLERTEGWGRLRAAVESMDEDARSVFALYASGMRAGEIAATLGLTEQAIRKRKSRLFAELRRVLVEG